MKRFIFFLVLVLLAGCLPSTSILIGKRTAPDKVHYSAIEGPTLSVSSSLSITDWYPMEACEYKEITAGPDLALTCTAPIELDVYTLGSTSANIHNGYIPVSRSVKVE